MGKVKEINLEYGSPTAEAAVRNMVSQLSSCKGQGYKAVILIHGYGSSGVGGRIRTEVRKKLRDSSLSGMIRGVCGGEQWHTRRSEFISICCFLKEYERRISGNEGVTIVLLK